MSNIYQDLTGRIFGELTVISRHPQRKNKNAQWNCRCSCGTEKILSGNNLRCGRTNSCGCRGVPSLVGRRFSRALVVSRIPIKIKPVDKWNCLCDCGGEFISNGSDLKRGKVKSCGCLHAETFLSHNPRLNKNMSYRGYFRPLNPEKYKGDPKGIVYRSGLEFRAMRWLDSCKDIVQWQSEEFFIPYFDPSTQKNRRYFIDLWVKNKNGEETIIEIKPHIQTLPPQPKKYKRHKRLLSENLTFATNMAKFEAAAAFAHKRGWKFVVMTEHDIAKLGPHFGRAPKKAA